MARSRQYQSMDAIARTNQRLRQDRDDLREQVGEQDRFIQNLRLTIKMLQVDADAREAMFKDDIADLERQVMELEAKQSKDYPTPEDYIGNQVKLSDIPEDDVPF